MADTKQDNLRDILNLAGIELDDLTDITRARLETLAYETRRSLNRIVNGPIGDEVTGLYAASALLRAQAEVAEKAAAELEN